MLDATYQTKSHISNHNSSLTLSIAVHSLSQWTQVSGYYYPHRKYDLDVNLLKKNKHRISNHGAHTLHTTISMDLFHTVFVSQCYTPSFPYQTYKNHHDALSSSKHNASQHLLPTHISHPDQTFPP